MILFFLFLLPLLIFFFFAFLMFFLFFFILQPIFSPACVLSLALTVRTLTLAFRQIIPAFRSYSAHISMKRLHDQLQRPLLPCYRSRLNFSFHTNLAVELHYYRWLHLWRWHLMPFQIKYFKKSSTSRKTEGHIKLLSPVWSIVKL